MGKGGKEGAERVRDSGVMKHRRLYYCTLRRKELPTCLPLEDVHCRTFSKFRTKPKWKNRTRKWRRVRLRRIINGKELWNVMRWKATNSATKLEIKSYRFTSSWAFLYHRTRNHVVLKSSLTGGPDTQRWRRQVDEMANMHTIMILPTIKLTKLPHKCKDTSLFSDFFIQ